MPFVDKRPRLHLIPRRWCLVANKKGVLYYVKTQVEGDAGPKRYFKGPGINRMAGYHEREYAEKVAARPANRLYHVEEAHRHIALNWFRKLKWSHSQTHYHEYDDRRKPKTQRH